MIAYLVPKESGKSVKYFVFRIERDRINPRARLKPYSMFWLFRRVFAAGPLDRFEGTWIHVDNENWEAIINHFGFGPVDRYFAITLKPTIKCER